MPRPACRMTRKEAIVEHDARLVRESLQDFFMCEEPAEAPSARSEEFICGKWRPVPGRRHGGDEKFTCSMAGFHCNDPEDEKWMSLHGFSGAKISARDEVEMKGKPILENSIRHMLHKISAGGLWMRKTGDRAENKVNAMLNQLQDPKSLELTVLGRGPERVGRLKRILEWIWENVHIQREHDELMKDIREELKEVRDRRAERAWPHSIGEHANSDSCLRRQRPHPTCITSAGRSKRT